jgi:hypothetical protein
VQVTRWIASANISAVAITLLVCFAVICIALVIARSKRLGGKTKVGIKGPLGTQAEFSEEQIAPTSPKVEGEGLKSRAGSIQAINELGGGVSVKNAEAQQDVKLLNTDRRLEKEETGPKA